MAQPTFIDQYLTGVSNAWFNQDNDFIADKIFPEVLVDKKTFKVPGYGKDGLRIPSSSVRTGESKAKRISLSRTEQDMGPLQEHSLSDFVTKEDQDMTDDPYDALADSTENLNQVMMLIDEKDVATTLSDTATITQNTTKSGNGRWDNYGSSTPFNDIKTGVITTKGSMLKPANTFFTSWEVWMTLVDHPDFLDRIKWSSMGVMTEADFLKLMLPYGITKIFIGKASENTGKEGLSDSLSTVWGKHAWLAYVTDKPGRKQVNGGYKFRLRDAREVSRETKANPKGDEIVNTDYYDNALINDTCFYLMKTVIN